MGIQNSKKPPRKARRKQENNESVSDYHCYSCDISSERNIENNNIFKELLKASVNNQTHHNFQRSNVNSILNTDPSSILKQSMAISSIISDTFNKEISLNYLLSYRLEQNIGQLHYSFENQAFDSSSQSDACFDCNRKIYRKYNKNADKDNAESDANRYRNYLMNDTISTRTESTLKGKVNVVIINNNKTTSDNNTININTSKVSQIYKKPSVKENSLKVKPIRTINKPLTSETSNRKVSPRSKVIIPINNNKIEQKRNNMNQEANKKKDLVMQSSKVRVFEIKPQAKGGGKRGLSSEKENQRAKENINNKAKGLKVSDLKLNTSNANAQLSLSPSNKLKKHIYHPNNKPKQYSKTPDRLFKQSNNNQRIKVKNLNININSLNVINTIKQIESNDEEVQRSKSKDQALKANRNFLSFKVNLSQVLGRTSREDSSNSIEKEKYSLNSQDSNPRDIRRIDTPQFHQHKKSLSSKNLCEFNPNTSNLNSIDQPLSGEKLSFGRLFSLKGQF